MSILQQALIFAAAAVIAVPLFKRLGLGTVLGYLAAGAVIGPFGVGIIGDVESVLHTAELGVVFFLFLIGIELQPSRLWAMRRTVFGVGTAQFVATTLLLWACAGLLGVPWRGGLVAAFGLSLSSTALALQLLAERNELATPHGQASFGILLFQDLAVIPALAALPILAGETASASAKHMPITLAAATGWPVAPIVGGMALLIYLMSRYVVPRLFRVVAATHSQELFTATALLLVLGTAILVSKVGLSMPLGAFLAGMLLSDSEYRHELEADIAPFKGLLLGLFFIAVGMSVNLKLAVAQPFTVLGLVLGLLVVKIGVLYLIGQRQLQSREQALSLGFALSQGGEFAFVLFGLAVGFHLMNAALSDLLVVVISLSMAVTPALFTLHERAIRPRLRKSTRPFDVAPEEDVPVIIAGFGRMGQVAGRVLRAKRIPFTAMDINPDHIDFVRKFGAEVFFGDASRVDLLRAARADKARVFFLAIDDIEASVRTAETILAHFPNLVIIARARNRQHAYYLRNLGIEYVFRETFVTSLEMTELLLGELGFSYPDAHDAMERFRAHDEAMVETTFPHHKDEKKLLELANRARDELESLFKGDSGTV